MLEKVNFLLKSCYDIGLAMPSNIDYSYVLERMEVPIWLL
jgi:hypothetical protein